MNVVIAGAGSLGRECYYTILENNNVGKNNNYLNVLGFIDDTPSKIGTYVDGLKVYSIQEITELDTEFHAIIAVGSPDGIKTFREKLTGSGINKWISVVHPTAYVANNVILGEGCFIAANASISICANIRDHSIINQNCSVGHDVYIGNGSVVSPGCVLSGYTVLGDSVFMGSGSITHPKVKIGNNSIVASNCVVHKDIGEKVKLMPVIRNVETRIETDQ